MGLDDTRDIRVEVKVSGMEDLEEFWRDEEFWRGEEEQSSNLLSESLYRMAKDCGFPSFPFPCKVLCVAEGSLFPRIKHQYYYTIEQMGQVYCDAHKAFKTLHEKFLRSQKKNFEKAEKEE